MTGDEIRAQREKCADCGGALQEIKVRQTGTLNDLMPLIYFASEAKEHNWMGNANMAAVEGTLIAFMCSSCARVSFYGAAKEQKGNTKSKPADDDR